MGDEITNQQPSSRRSSEAPGNVEDLDQYTGHPQVRIGYLPKPRRLSKAQRLAHESFNFGFEFCDAGFEEARKAYHEARQKVSQYLVHRRRREMCQRAAKNDMAIEPSKIPEKTEWNRLHCSLLKLPLELRLQIYEWIYSPHATVAIRNDIKSNRIKASMEQYDLHDPACHLKRTSCPCFVRRVAFNLPLTCRQLYCETIHYL